MIARVSLARPASARMRFGAASLSRLRGRSHFGVAKARGEREILRPRKEIVYYRAGG